MSDAKEPGANAVGHQNPITAVITALSDMFSEKGQLPPMAEEERLDGKIALVTGSNTGLGKATAIELAKRGAHVIMACRSGHPEAGEEVKEASGSNHVEMMRVDLSDLDSVAQFCDDMKQKGQSIDIAVFNAGLMPARARKGVQGYELMFMVHFLATRLIVSRFLKDGVIRPDPTNIPRIVLVSSEAHQSSKPIDFDTFGDFVDYGLKDGMAEYGRTKLHLCTYAHELAKRLNPDEDQVSISVHSLCPGPIASDIAREAPSWAKPVLGPIMRMLFRSPEKASEPVMLLAGGNAMEGRNGVYLHMLREKQVSVLAANPENGKELWERSEKLLTPYLN